MIQTVVLSIAQGRVGGDEGGGQASSRSLWASANLSDYKESKQTYPLLCSVVHNPTVE